ncbi:hypothetical protein N665_2279s0008 [Sinapis alba]|nr:hypothetical protein N665_2279s0008 [Sinapis alba]
MASSSSSLFIITFLLLAPLCFSFDSPSQIPNGTLDLSLLWYGPFTPVQKERVQDFIESLNYDAKEGLDPKVSAWWKVVESYQERYEVTEIYQHEKSNRTVAPRIKVKIVRSYVDEKMKYGKEITIENGEKLVETAMENMSKVVPVVFLSAQVRSHGLGFCNKTCQRYALTVKDIKGKEKPQPYVMVSDPEVQCPGECAWPFHIANKGPHGMTYQPPSGEIGADALVIQLATGLADIAANPALTETLFKSEPPYITDVGNQSSPDYIEEPATKCIRVFGSGAFPGFTGRIRVDPITGGAFNSHGINHLKFLIPSVWDPKTKSCWTPM